MTRRQLVALLSAAAALGLGGSSIKWTFSALNARDRFRRLGHGLAYGPDPHQQLDVFGPERASRNLPVAVFFYGGAWNSGRRQDYAFAAQALASRGFLVVIPDYRVFPQVIYPDFVDDCARAVRWAQDHAGAYGGDPARTLLIGHSAGAYMALQLAMDDRFLQTAGVSPGSIKGAIGLSGPYDFYPFVRPDAHDAFGPYKGDPRTSQPITYAALPGRPPVLLIAGGQDDDVDPQNSVRMDKALKAAGNPSTLHIYPTLNHPQTIIALSAPLRDTAPILDEVVRFMIAVAGPPGADPA